MMTYKTRCLVRRSRCLQKLSYQKLALLPFLSTPWKSGTKKFKIYATLIHCFNLPVQFWTREKQWLVSCTSILPSNKVLIFFCYFMSLFYFLLFFIFIVIIVINVFYSYYIFIFFLPSIPFLSFISNSYLHFLRVSFLFFTSFLLSTKPPFLLSFPTVSMTSFLPSVKPPFLSFSCLSILSSWHHSFLPVFHPSFLYWLSFPTVFMTYFLSSIKPSFHSFSCPSLLFSCLPSCHPSFSDCPSSFTFVPSFHDSYHLFILISIFSIYL